MLRSSATSFYNADGLGSITSLGNAAGSLAQTYTFDSFGKQTASTGSLVNPFQYTAREKDTETGLYYYRARYYDASVGRFLSEDPVGFVANSDFYSYVSNSPVSLLDPLGLQKKGSVLGKNPTPKMVGNDLDVFDKSLDFAEKTACDRNCDGALQLWHPIVGGARQSNLQRTPTSSMVGSRLTP